MNIQVLKEREETLKIELNELRSSIVYHRKDYISWRDDLSFLNVTDSLT